MRLMGDNTILSICSTFFWTFLPANMILLIIVLHLQVQHFRSWRSVDLALCHPQTSWVVHNLTTQTSKQRIVLAVTLDIILKKNLLLLEHPTEHLLILGSVFKNVQPKAETSFQTMSAPPYNTGAHETENILPVLFLNNRVKRFHTLRMRPGG